MSYTQYLRDILEPLRVYDLNASYNGGELDTQGMALDGVEAELEDVQRESCLFTAENWGLEQISALFYRRPATTDTLQMRQALSALLRIGADSFTPQAINDTLTGCGVNCQVSETGQAGVVEVRFPQVVGIPDRFDEIKEIIEGILPAHLQADYVFWYLTWAELEQQVDSWNALEEAELDWAGLETLVE